MRQPTRLMSCLSAPSEFPSLLPFQGSVQLPSHPPSSPLECSCYSLFADNSHFSFFPCPACLHPQLLQGISSGRSAVFWCLAFLPLQLSLFGLICRPFLLSLHLFFLPWRAHVPSFPTAHTVPLYLVSQVFSRPACIFPPNSWAVCSVLHKHLELNKSFLSPSPNLLLSHCDYSSSI